MDNCRQACPYNTLDGCKVKEYNKICPLTNMATPVTEYRMTNADKIRSMTDEELSAFLCEKFDCRSESCPGIELCKPNEGKANGILRWLQKQAE